MSERSNHNDPFVLSKSLSWLAVSIRKWLDKQLLTPCVHGIPGGETNNRCSTCVRRQKQIEERWKRSISLQRSEYFRLVKSLIPSIEELRRLSPQNFENEIARMFERLGYTVAQTPYVNDHGRDAILKKDGKKFLLECKRYGKGVASGRPDLQKFHSAIVTDRAVSGFFVTTGEFTKDAGEFAGTVPIELLGQKELVRMMFASKPAAANDDLYRSICCRCGENVEHRLRVPQSVNCLNGHGVAPTLTLKQVLSGTAPDEASVAIIGNTYPVRHQLKALGGWWNPDRKAWMVPIERAEEATRLVAPACSADNKSEAMLFEDARVAYQSGDYATAMQIWHFLGKQGHAGAQCCLGGAYEKGNGVPQDDIIAQIWYRRAADQGHAAAQGHLGFFYSKGRGGLPKDEHEAARLYKLAADQGNATARHNLKVFYKQGRGGLPKDESEAVL